MSNFSRSSVSWKKVAVGLLVFFVLLFFADKAFFKAFRALERNMSRFNLEAKLRAIPEKGKYEVLVFGTSRTFNAIQPKYVNPVIGTRLFKEAFVDKGPKYNYYFYRMYKRIFGVPRVVVYGLDYFLFERGSSASLLRDFPECADAYEPDEGVPSLLLANKERTELYINSALKTMQGKIMSLLRRSHRRKPSAEREGYSGNAVPSESRVVTKIPSDFDKRKASYKAFPRGEGEYFRLLLEALKKDGVTVLLITIPDHIGTFMTQQTHARFVEDHRKILERLDYRGHAFLIDYNSLGRFPAEDEKFFSDGGYGKVNSHLNKEGSRIFCEMLSRDLAGILDEFRNL